MITVIVMMYMASVLDAPAWIHALLMVKAVGHLVSYSAGLYKAGQGGMK